MRRVMVSLINLELTIERWNRRHALKLEGPWKVEGAAVVWGCGNFLFGAVAITTADCEVEWQSYKRKPADETARAAHDFLDAKFLEMGWTEEPLPLPRVLSDETLAILKKLPEDEAAWKIGRRAFRRVTPERGDIDKQLAIEARDPSAVDDERGVVEHLLDRQVENDWNAMRQMAGIASDEDPNLTAEMMAKAWLRLVAPKESQEIGAPDANRAEGHKGGPTVRTVARFEVFERIKSEHEGWSQPRLAEEARKELGDGITEETVKNVYKAMGVKWQRADRIR